MRTCTITVLVENTAGGRGLLGEHGISFLIETDSHRVLFDTGQGFVLQHNAKQLGISLDHLDAVALSHGHYDHTGGLPDLLSHISCPALFVHPGALSPKYSPRGEIGSPLQEEHLKQQVGRMVWTEKPTEVVPGVYLTGTIPRNHPLEDTGGKFWLDRNHDTIDPILDDQALYVETPVGLVVVLGCAHAGVINTLDHIAQITGRQRFYAVIGGMHLLRANVKRLRATADTLEHYKVEQIGANHCTGVQAIAFFWQEFSDRCLDCRVGTRLKFGDG
ncbi:MBL fold metallo-hydrolase [Spirulina sp. CS-785/01]|uniref:MBL fold metallo-hydrolase n=1 Tax=Spirulina sp. CS-785/01 TaxID=3021716 RepID=UPI00232D4FBC|nr:MBL fold metallo-hydrolase [Spirulina sp. CS-785/01]MDB9315273.1 MBL fold metallo-hydrolase [Spirulina sp. CS-785/01]